MVDFVAQKMPSENDVHVARSFLTKILRSSMRRNEPINRPHSWHSSKFNENQSETGKRQSSSTARNDTSSSASDISSGWELIDLPSTSNQFSSLDSMDNLEHVSHSYPADQLSPAKSNNGMEHLGERKRDSAYSSISTSSITPDCTKSNTASTENVPFKVFQWDAGAKKNDVRNSQSLVPEWVKHNDRFTYFQMPGVNSGHSGLQTEDSTGCRHSTSSRTNFGPVWNVPENKKPASPSPPPPLPPAHRDSFALTKVHERGIVSTHPEGPDSHENHHIFHKNHIENVNTSSDKFNHTHSSSKKQHSYLSVVQQGHDPHNRHGHQSDKSTSHPLTWAISVPKPPTEGGSYSVSLPTNRSTHFTQDHRQNLSTSLSSSNTDQNTDSTGSSRYYCVTTGQPTHQNRLSMSDVPEDRRGEADGENEQHTFKAQAGTRVKYHLSQQQQHSSHGKDSSAYSMHQVTTVPETYGLTPSSDYVGQKGHDTQTTECLYITNLAKRQPEQRKSLPAQIRDLPQDTRNHNQVNNKICPQTTPMFHSLSMDVTSQEEKVRDTKSEDFLEGKQVNRNSRFATTLRNEIQITARLQKSKSAATLPDAECVMEEDQNVWKSTENSTPASAGVCFSNSYKDHLKEAQARVLKATSFRRKDLEPVLQEHPAAEAQPSYTSSVQARKDVTPLPAVTESNNSGLSCGQVTRIGSRKRFPSEKKILSFSEPDKIHEVGVGESLTITENASSSLDHQYFLKEIIKPEFPNPIPPQSHSENEGDHHASCSSTENAMKEVKYAEEAPGVPHFTQSFQDYQRLGTFAEYEARWNIKKKPAENKASGRSHSADNILDPGPEDRMKTTCFHERSRSSPSADFYGQKVPSPVTKSDTECSHIESKPAEPTNLNTRFSDCASGKVAEKPAEFENYPAPPAPPRTGAKPDYRQGAAAAIMNHKSISYSFPEPDDHSYAEPPSSGQRRKASALEKPPPTRNQDVNSHESFTSFPNDVFAHRSANFEPNSTFHPIYSAKGDPEQGEGQGAVNHQSPPSPQSSPAFPYRPSRHYSMEGHCSPSPQFSPQRLSDKPPVSLHNDEANRMEQIIENQNTSVRKVPIRIVHSEGSVEKKNSPFLQQSDLPLIESKGHDVARLSSLRALGQDSVFSVFTSQKEPGKTAGSHMQQRDVYMTTVGDYSTSNSQQLLQPTDEPSRKRETTGLTEQEDQKRNVLARDIMWKDKSLVDILDQRKMKTTMDLMEGIFPQGEQLLEGGHHRKKVQPKRADSIPAEDREKEDSMAVAVAMMTSSTYYSTSAPKAELLIKMKDMQDQNEDDSEDELDMDLANKKQELIDSLSKKLHVLREAKESLLEDILDNNTLGNEVEVRVQQICKPNELEKFRMFVGDLDKAVSLLLSLSGRLARVENALNSLEEDATSEERRTLIEKRKLLIRQHEDAKELKENLDRREQVVYDILSSYLPEDSLADYEHFVKMKSALIIEQRKLEDKIKLGEEQLKCLTDSLPLEQRLAL